LRRARTNPSERGLSYGSGSDLALASSGRGFVAVKGNGECCVRLPPTKIPLRKSLAYCLVFCMTAFIAGCSGSHENSYVRKGDLFFDDAMSRLSPTDRERLEENGPENIRGFAFKGDRKTCVVVFSVRKKLVTHAPDPAYCYDNATNQFIEKL